ncbi:MAG: urea ABC transporter permease subunit UrtB [Gammaproteobacteria bacterium]
MRTDARKTSALLAAALIWLWCGTAAAAAGYAEAAARLATPGFAELKATIGMIADSGSPNARTLLVALLDGRVHRRDADSRVFIIEERGDAYALTDATTLAPAGTAGVDDLTRITTNNQIRKMLKGLIGQFDLSAPDRQVRLDAVREMLRSPDQDTAAKLRARLEKEPDAEVRREISVGLAVAALSSERADDRLDAVRALRGNLGADVYARLSVLAQDNADGTPVEPDPLVRGAALAALAQIDRQRAFYSAVETGFFGLSLGSVLVLSAIGLAITFGVMGVINMAHGELMMLGAYTTYVVQILMPERIELSILVAIPAAFMVAGIAGIAIERGVIRWLYGRPLETLLATFGVSLVLQQVVRDVFSANNRPVQTPQWMSGSLQINDALALTYNRLYVIAFMLVVFLALVALLRWTSLGLKVRAVSQNRAMARAMGVRTDRVDALTFGLGSGIAGIAGVALSQLTNVGPNLGQSYIVDSFMVVVFGGVGNLWGTLVGGLSLGVANKLLEPWVGAVLAKILMLVFIIVFIQKRPRGLFPQRGRAAEA